jgi:hypothetical protein
MGLYIHCNMQGQGRRGKFTAAVAQSVWRLATAWMTEGSELTPGGVKNRIVQTDSGARPASCPIGRGEGGRFFLHD